MSNTPKKPESADQVFSSDSDKELPSIPELEAYNNELEALLKKTIQESKQTES